MGEGSGGLDENRCRGTVWESPRPSRYRLPERVLSNKPTYTPTTSLRVEGRGPPEDPGSTEGSRG